MVQFFFTRSWEKQANTNLMNYFNFTFMLDGNDNIIFVMQCYHSCLIKCRTGCLPSTSQVRDFQSDFTYDLFINRYLNSLHIFRSDTDTTLTKFCKPELSSFFNLIFNLFVYKRCLWSLVLLEVSGQQ